MSDHHDRQRDDREQEAQQTRERDDLARLDAERAWRRELEAHRQLELPLPPREPEP
jgi:hypothetical protein